MTRLGAEGMTEEGRKLLLVLGVVGVFLIVIAVIGGIFSLLMPILVPVLVVAFILRLIGGTRR